MLEIYALAWLASQWKVLIFVRSEFVAGHHNFGTETTCETSVINASLFCVSRKERSNIRGEPGQCEFSDVVPYFLCAMYVVRSTSVT